MCTSTLQKSVAITLSLIAFAGTAAAATASTGKSERETAALAALRTIAHSKSCGGSCVAAYRLVAEALPGDRSNSLARAILATPRFDYERLGRALEVPTALKIEAQWRRRGR